MGTSDCELSPFSIPPHTAPVASPDIRKLAKSGKADELVALWKQGQRFDLKSVFERAVTDFRTVKRNPGHARLLRFCISEGLEIDRETVQWLAQYANNDLITYLMQAGRLPENDPFIAAYIGDLDKLRHHSKLDALQDDSGLNLLHATARSGLGRKDSAMKDALSATCAHLIAKGVSASATAELDVTTSPAYCCSAFGGSAAIMRQLLDSGQVDIANLHLELEFALEPHQRSGEPFYDVAQEILDHGFDLNSIRPSQGRTLLHGCANRATKKAVAWLLEKGADPNALDIHGNAPLHVAAQRNTTPNVIKLLIHAGAEIDAADADGRTALDIAKAKGRERVVASLSSAG